MIKHEQLQAGSMSSYLGQVIALAVSRINPYRCVIYFSIVVRPVYSEYGAWRRFALRERDYDDFI